MKPIGMSDSKWVTRDGRRLNPSCMTCDHLRHSIARILRLGWRLRWLDVLTDEYTRRCNPPQIDARRFNEKEVA